MKNPCTHTTMKLSTLIFGVILTLASCGEIYDQNGFDFEPDIPLSDSVYNREIQILDLGVANIPEGHRPFDGRDPLFFSLERISSTHLGYQKSTRWDMAFSGLYRHEISSNNGSAQGTYGRNAFGYGGGGLGGILVIDSAYSEVNEIPPDSYFQAPGIIGMLGLDDYIGTADGYCFYTFFGNVFRPDLAENNDRYWHMLYCFSEDFVEAFPDEYGSHRIKATPKTIIVRTALGNYAKVEIQSFYKNTLDPLDMRRSAEKPVPYFSFRYMVIKKEERRFGFVERRPPLTVDLTTKKVTVGQ